MSVLVYLENWDGKFKKLSYELVSYANGIAQQLNTSVVALSIGNVEGEELKKVSLYGASKIIAVNDPKFDQLVNQAYASVISQVAVNEQASVLVFAGNMTGKAVAPRVAVKLKAGMVTGAVALPQTTDPFVVKKKVYTGKAFASVLIKSSVKIITLAQNAYGLHEQPAEPVVEQFSPQLPEKDFATTVIETNMLTGKLLLTDAEIVVSGGRGMKGPEFWQPIEELAALLGGATACSRPVADEGWRPHHEHVGQTGKIIAPTVYFAFGISGAIQHLGGVSSSKIIVAVNKDKDAPIFEAANYGVVGDVATVLPALIKCLKDIKGQ
ncbi:MAG TPA: electron transfer flavoprotein subunit alpha/FixB family protein [Bacteroidales bacterium]|nr:electron transfer flavoprotein subunit alpha/FixB family protein [Bacteroidales bacterium]HQI69388.1 electron transfer flavoprotein subunit alpha/FixB family protein [Bacteroidales bacterium]